ncbi:response regulator, partial [Acinetobacter baumannii]
TGNDDERFALDALRGGGQDYLVKSGLEPATLLRAIRYARERAKLERELRQSEERFRDYAESSADWFWEQGPDLRFTFISGRL